MTSEQILQWCMDRVSMKRDDICTYSDTSWYHKVTFENGDVYENIESNERWSNVKNVIIKLNGKVVYEKMHEWYNFGWREIA